MLSGPLAVALLRRLSEQTGSVALSADTSYPEPKRAVHSELKVSTWIEIDKGDLSRARAIVKGLSGSGE